MPLGLAQPKEQPRLLQQLSRFCLLPFPEKKIRIPYNLNAPRIAYCHGVAVRKLHASSTFRLLALLPSVEHGHLCFLILMATFAPLLIAVSASVVYSCQLIPSGAPFDLQRNCKHCDYDKVRLRGDWSQDSSVGYGLYGRGVAFRFSPENSFIPHQWFPQGAVSIPREPWVVTL